MTDPIRYPTFVAFSNGVCIARGALPTVARAAKIAMDAGAPQTVQVFDAETSEPWDLDLSGTLDDVERRHQLDDTPLPRSDGRPKAGPGRPRLGVVAREVTLLPRHWAWLAEQPGGASAALRRLVDEARLTHAGRDVIRRAQERAYRFMSYAAGDAPGFEEAARALFARDHDAFLLHTTEWPADVQAHARAVAAPVFGPS
jgi:uncharacterized protein